MNFIKKIFKKDENVSIEEKQVTDMNKKDPKRTMPKENGKELYRKEKEERRKKAEQARIEAQKEQEAAQAAELRKIEEDKKQKAIELEQRRQKQKAEPEKASKEVKHEENKEEAIDLYGFEITELHKGDIVEIEILAEERDKFIAQAVSNSQNVILPKIEIEQNKVDVGDTVEVLIFKYYAEEYYASIRRLENKRKLVEQLDKIEKDEVVSGKVISFRHPNFIVEIDGALKGKVYIKNMDISYVSDPKPYLEKTFDFIVVSKHENSKNAQLELDRRSLLNKKQKELISNIAVDQVIVINEYTFNKGGIEFFYNGIRGFVPISELSHKFYNNTKEAEADFTGPQSVKIKEISTKRGQVNIVGSIKALSKSPWENFIENIARGSEITGPVVKIENYGLFINIYDNVDGLLHNSEFNPSLAADIKNIKIGDMLTIIIKEIDYENRRVALTTLNEESEVE